MVCTYTLSGADAGHYLTPSPISMTIVAASTFTLTDVFTQIAISQTSTAVTVKPVEAPFNAGGVDFQITCTSGTPSPATLHFDAGSWHQDVYLHCTSCSWFVYLYIHSEWPGCCSLQSICTRMPITITPRALIQFNPPVPSSLTVSQASGAIELTPSVGAFFTSVTVSVACSAGSVSGSPLTWPLLDTAGKAFVFTAPASAQTVTCTYTLSGNDAGHYEVPAPSSIAIVAQSYFTIATLPASLTMSSTTPSISVTPAHAPFFTGVTLTISCGAGVGSFIPASGVLTFPPSVTTAQTFKFIAPAATGSITCTFVVGGVDAPHYIQPLSHTMQITAKAAFVSSPLPTSLAQAQTTTVISLTPSEAPIFTSVIVSLDCDNGGVVTTSPLTFPSASIAPLTFTITAPPAPFTGAMVCTYTLSGADAGHYLTPSPFTITIDVKGSIVASGHPTSVTVSGTTPTITMQPNQLPALSGMSVAITCTSGTPTPAVLPFTAGSPAPQTWTFTAPTITGTSTCTFVISGSDASHWNSIPAIAFTITNKATFTFGSIPSTLSVSQSSLSISIAPTVAPMYDSVMMTISCTYGTTSVATLTWTTTTPQPFVYTAPSSVQVDTCTYVLSGTDAAQFITPPSTSINIVGLADFIITTMPTQLTESATTPTIFIKPSTAPFFPVTLTASCGTGVGTFVPAGGVLNFPASVTAAKTLTFTAPATLGPIVCTFSVSGVDAAHFNTPLDVNVLITAKAAFTSTAVPTSLAQSQTTNVISLTPSESPVFTSAIVSLSCDNGGLVTTSPLTFPAGSVAPRTFTITAPGSPFTGAMVCTYTLSGADAGHYLTPSPISMTIVAASTFTLTDVFTQIAISQTSTAVTVKPVEAPFNAGGVDFQITCTSGTPSPATLHFDAGSVASKTFTYTAPPAAGSSTCTFTVSGPDAAHYNPSALSMPITITPRALIQFNPPVPSSLTVSQASGAIELTPSVGAFFTSVTVAVSCNAGVISGSPLTWLAGVTTGKSFVFTAPASTQTVTCTYVLSGNDAGHYEVPAPSSIEIVAQSHFTIATLPASLTMSSTTPSISVTPAHAPFFTGVTLTISCGAGVGSFLPASGLLSFPPGVTTAVQFKFTAPSSPGSITCTFAVGGIDAPHYAPPSPVTINITPKATFTITNQVTQLAVSQTSQVLTVTPNEAPD